jgi:hypothetical protein
MRLLRNGPLVTALIYQPCPIVLPQPTAVEGPPPEDWCRPQQRPPHYAALIDGKPADVIRVWATRSLRRVSRAEYEFRLGPLRRWALANPVMPEARPTHRIDLAALPPLF